jgi:hypothetical protein
MATKRKAWRELTPREKAGQILRNRRWRLLLRVRSKAALAKQQA